MADRTKRPPINSAPIPGWPFAQEVPSSPAPAPGPGGFKAWPLVTPNKDHPVSTPGWQLPATNAPTSGGFTGIAGNPASPQWAPFQEPLLVAPYGYSPAPAPTSDVNPGWMSPPLADAAVSSTDGHWAPTPAPSSTGGWESNEQTEDEDQWDNLSAMSVDRNDYDSAIGMGSTNSSAASMTESIFRFREENGRTYHSYKAGESAYFLPNDAAEQERMHLQHDIFKMSQDGQLHLCPAGKDMPLHRVLDAGTANGLWAIDFAELHPETAVIGVDLSPIQSLYVPQNVDFFVDDLEENWEYETPFDFIYMRMITGGIRDWPRLMSQAFENLAPGGWLEICDTILPATSDDGSLKEDSAFYQWNSLLVSAMEIRGASLASARHYKQQMLDVGFQDVHEVQYKWPIGTWAPDPKHKEVGYWMMANILSVFESSSLDPFTKVHGWSVEQINELIKRARTELLNDPSIHSYFPMRVVYGRKPF